MVEHHIVMRWGDIDSYVHVNNVRYVDYLAEARDRLVTEGLLAADHQVAGLAIDFVAPMFLTRSPIIVTSDLDGDRLVQEICIDRAEGRIVHARAVTDLGPADPQPFPVTDVDGILVQEFEVRLYDLGPDGTVTPERETELIQELRIDFRGRDQDPDVWGKSVVAAIRLERFGPIKRDATGQVARSWTSHIGTSSYVVELEIRAGDEVMLRATTVQVALDPATQGSRPLTPQERSALTVVASARQNA